jgi:hypothetical protein
VRGSLLAGGAVVAALLLTGCSADPDDDRAHDDPRGTPSTTPSSSAATAAPPQSSVSAQAQTGRPTPRTDVPSEAADAASEAATGFADAIGAALADPDQELPGDIGVSGAAREALRAQAEEYELSGWRITGRPRVVSVEVYERADDRMVIGACLDNSPVSVVDRTGAEVPGSGNDGPTLNILTLADEDGRWVIVGSTFPADPDC